VDRVDRAASAAGPAVLVADRVDSEVNLKRLEDWVGRQVVPEGAVADQAQQGVGVAEAHPRLPAATMGVAAESPRKKIRSERRITHQLSLRSIPATGQSQFSKDCGPDCQTAPMASF
jgi:hypothetical protein